jgi:RimJ/RimL family protein N-acetyltransferase
VTFPVVETERLTLRVFEERDFDDYARWHADDETMRYVGGKPMSREDAWRSMATMVGHWTLRGYGMWAVVERASQQLVARVGLWRPEGWPGVEVGWMTSPAARRRGFALEAARASLQWGFANLAVDRIVSVIHVDNAPSIALAKALGESFVEHREIRGMPVGIWAVERTSTRA